jgi:hypothetical protein
VGRQEDGNGCECVDSRDMLERYRNPALSANLVRKVSRKSGGERFRPSFFDHARRGGPRGWGGSTGPGPALSRRASAAYGSGRPQAGPSSFARQPRLTTPPPRPPAAGEGVWGGRKTETDASASTRVTCWSGTGIPGCPRIWLVTAAPCSAAGRSPLRSVRPESAIAFRLRQPTGPDARRRRPPCPQSAAPRNAATRGCRAQRGRRALSEERSDEFARRLGTRVPQGTRRSRAQPPAGMAGVACARPARQREYRREPGEAGRSRLRV